MPQETVQTGNPNRAVTAEQATREAIRRENLDFLRMMAGNANSALLAPPLDDEPEGARQLLHGAVINNLAVNFTAFTQRCTIEQKLQALQELSDIVLANVPEDIRRQFVNRMAQVDLSVPEDKVYEPVVSTAQLDIDTQQLEEMVQNVTDEAVSPPRGIRLQRIQASLAHLLAWTK